MQARDSFGWDVADIPIGQVMRQYHRPEKLEFALRLVEQGPFQVLAGGTDLICAWTQASAWNAPPTEPILDLSAIEELREIRISGSSVDLGSCVTWAEIARASLPPGFEALKQAATQIGGVQIQSRATIGGNLCNASPAADGIPPLLALDASVELVSSEGSRRLPVSDFVVGNRKTLRNRNELVRSIYVPRPPSSTRSSFLKLGARRYLVISLSMVAVVADIVSGVVRDIRIAVGACAATAIRLRSLEAALNGRAVTELPSIVSIEHFSVLSPISDVRASASYRLEATQAIVRRSLRVLAEQS